MVAAGTPPFSAKACRTSSKKKITRVWTRSVSTSGSSTPWLDESGYASR